MQRREDLPPHGSIDHLGHIPYGDCVQLLRRLEKYHLSWAEDVLSWRNTEQWKQLHAAVELH